MLITQNYVYYKVPFRMQLEQQIFVKTQTLIILTLK